MAYTLNYFTMTDKDIPITSADILDDPSLKREEDVPVVQVRHANEKDDSWGFNHHPATIVPSTNVTLNDTPPNKSSIVNFIHPDIAAFKEQRKRNQKIALVAGFVVGCIICGPILGVIGAGAAHAIVKYRGRAKQSRKEEQLRKSIATVVNESNRKELS